MTTVPKPTGPRNEIVFGEPISFGHDLPPIQVLTDDDKAEIYSLLIASPAKGQEGTLPMDVTDRINTIFLDKLKEVIEVIDSELQINPMNGDGGNYRINKIVNKLIKLFKLPMEERSYRWNGRSNSGH